MTMHRQLSSIPLIDSAGVDQVGAQVVSCFDPLTRFLTIAYQLDVTAKTLVGTLTIKGGADPDASTHSALTTATAYNTVTGAAVASGVLTFATPFPDVGSSYGLIRISDPPPYVSVAYDYTTGGGTNRLRAKAVY